MATRILTIAKNSKAVLAVGAATFAGAGVVIRKKMKKKTEPSWREKMMLSVKNEYEKTKKRIILFSKNISVKTSNLLR